MSKPKELLKMFDLIDKVDECKEDMLYNIAVKGVNRSQNFEKNANKLEAIVEEMQKLIEQMKNNSQ